MNAKTKVTKIIENDETLYLFEKNYTDVLLKNPINVQVMDKFLNELKKYPIPMDIANVKVQQSGTHDEKITLAKTIDFRDTCGTILSGERDCNTIILKVKPGGPLRDIMESLIEADDFSIGFRGLCNVKNIDGKTFGEKFNMVSIFTFEAKPYTLEAMLPTPGEINQNKDKHT